MATVREYAYYIKGNKVAIVEKDTQFDNDVNSKDYGPGSHRSQWKSPLATVSNGLEIQYVELKKSMKSTTYVLVKKKGSNNRPTCWIYIPKSVFFNIIKFFIIRMLR